MVKYNGKLVKGKLHGLGIGRYEDNSFYEGTYVNGMREGKGLLCTKDKVIIKSKFKDDKPNG
jgi:hypothetical protein